MLSRLAHGRRALALGLAALAGPSSALSQESSLAPFFHHTRLDNGLDVIVAENHAVPLATVLVAVRNGAFTQDSGQDGLAHLYEHVLFRAYRGDPQAFERDAGHLEGAFNGATTEEVVYYFAMVPADNVDGALKLMGGLLQDPSFSNRDLADERPIVLDELHRHASDPEDQLERQTAQALWGRSWSRKDVGGDSASLARINLDILKQTFGRYYVPNNAALIVTGDVTSERVFTKAREHFGDWKRGPDPFADRPIPPVEPRETNGVVLLAHDVRDVTIRVTLPGPGVGLDTGATYAADALFAALNDPASSCQQRLVNDGPFESLSARYTRLSQAGLIQFAGKTTPEQAQGALVRLLNELETLDVLEGLGDEGFTTAKKSREVEMAITRERIAMLAPALARVWSSAGLDYYLTYNAHVTALTLNDLRRFAATYVVGRPRVIGVLAPPETTQRLATWLRQGAGRGTR